MKLRHEETLRGREVEYETARFAQLGLDPDPGVAIQVRSETSPIMKFQMQATHDVVVRFHAAAVPGPDGPEVVVGDLRVDRVPWHRGADPSVLARVIAAEENIERVRVDANIERDRGNRLQAEARDLRRHVPDSPTWDVVW